MFAIKNISITCIHIKILVVLSGFLISVPKPSDISHYSALIGFKFIWSFFSVVHTFSFSIVQSSSESQLKQPFPRISFAYFVSFSFLACRFSWLSLQSGTPQLLEWASCLTTNAFLFCDVIFSWISFIFAAADSESLCETTKLSILCRFKRYLLKRVIKVIWFTCVYDSRCWWL